MSLTNTLVEIMKANENLDMEAVTALMAVHLNNIQHARVKYRQLVRSGKAPGKIISWRDNTQQTVKKVSTAKKAKTTKIKAVSPKVTNKPKITDKTVEEIEDIRNKNAARIKAVKKYQKGQYAEGTEGREHTDEEAKKIVEDFEVEIDNFDMPKFLNKK